MLGTSAVALESVDRDRLLVLQALGQPVHAGWDDRLVAIGMRAVGLRSDDAIIPRRATSAKRTAPRVRQRLFGRSATKRSGAP